MNKLETSLIDLSSIIEVDKEQDISTEANKAFIKNLAHSIVELQGLLRIPIVKFLGINDFKQTYRLIMGHLDYYAYLEALKLNKNLAPRIRVFVMNQENEKFILEQLNSIRRIESTNQSTNTTCSASLMSDNFSSDLANFQQSITKAISSQFSEMESIICQSIDAKIPQTLPFFEAVNNLDKPQVYEEAMNKFKFLGAKKSQLIIDQILVYKQAHPDLKITKFDQLHKIFQKGTISKEKLQEMFDQWI